MKTKSLIPRALSRLVLIAVGMSGLQAWACDTAPDAQQASGAVLSGIQVVPMTTFSIVELEDKDRDTLSGDYAAIFGENTLEARIQSAGEDVQVSLTFKEPGTNPVTQTYPSIKWCERGGIASKDVELRYTNTSDGVLLLIKASEIEQASSDIWYYLPRK